MPYIGNTVQTQGFTPAIDYFSGNGVTVTFTLTRPVASVAQMIVAVDNVIQNPSSAFTVSGSSITFTSAPLSGTNNIWVEYTSLITTYAAISQSPSVIGDITASGGYLATGNFNNSFIDGTIVDYVTGNGRITAGPADGITLYNGGTSARASLLSMNSSGAMGVGSSTSYGTAGQFLQTNGSSSAPTWETISYTTQFLIVGGGGGGSGGVYHGGGGGAGGYISSTATAVRGTQYTITVGAGGAGGVNTAAGNNGVNSSGFGLTAIGGGSGGNYSQGGAGGSGGSGGGSAYNGSGGSGTSGQGNAGGTGAASPPNYGSGGGGGAGAVGGNGTSTVGGSGGDGLNWQSLGTYYAGGGGGSTYNGGTAGSGGNGGGGGGSTAGNNQAASGGANTGGGGGGAERNTYTTGGAGGSGIIIIRYQSATQLGTGGTVTSSGGYYYHTFTSSGTYTA
jgi:hypothetical protein